MKKIDFPYGNCQLSIPLTIPAIRAIIFKKGGENMAFETKAMLSVISDVVVKAKSTKEVYKAIQKMANVEGVILKSYEEAKEELESDK